MKALALAVGFAASSVIAAQAADASGDKPAGAPEGCVWRAADGPAAPPALYCRTRSGDLESVRRPALALTPSPQQGRGIVRR